MTDRCERVILLQDLAEKRKLYDNLSFADPDWSAIAMRGEAFQILKEKAFLLSVSESDYRVRLVELRSEVTAFCRKLRTEKLLFIFPQVGKYHNQVKALEVLNGCPKDCKYNCVSFYIIQCGN